LQIRLKNSVPFLEKLVKLNLKLILFPLLSAVSALSHFLQITSQNIAQFLEKLVKKIYQKLNLKLILFPLLSAVSALSHFLQIR
jgi:hypothetical protein